MRAFLFLLMLAVSGCATSLASGAAGLFDATAAKCFEVEGRGVNLYAVRDTCNGLYDSLGAYVEHLQDLENHERGL